MAGEIASAGEPLVRDGRERLIEEILDRERARLEQLEGLGARPSHYRRPAERPFIAAERDRVTILLGGLTPFHDRLFPAALLASGLQCRRLPVPDLEAFQLGRQYGNVGQCNPAYFTIGNLLKFLLQIEQSGLSRQEIIDRYVFFTSGTCGPCRFGMYQTEYRLALRNAGFEGFRVLTFTQNDGLKADSGEPGLRFSVLLAATAFNACNMADVLHEFSHHARPYECCPGEVDGAVAEVIEQLYAHLSTRRPFDILDHAPRWLVPWLVGKPTLRTTLDTPSKLLIQLYGHEHAQALEQARERLARIQLDRLRVKPVVKITGEFWAQTTDGPGNYDMFKFLEGEGAEAVVEPVGGWVMYLLHQARMKAAVERRVARAAGSIPSAIAAEFHYRQRVALCGAGERWWMREYGRAARAMIGGFEPLPSQKLLAQLAHPFYPSLARGGEGHLEVGKTIYYTTRNRCHMVLSLKPFGCLPSTQSDGTQSAVVSRYPAVHFLSIETSGDGDLYARSRVQMAISDAYTAARDEFDAALRRTGRSLDEISAFVEAHPGLRSALYRVPRREGVAGVAATFVLHVDDLLRHPWRARRLFGRGTA